MRQDLLDRIRFLNKKVTNKLLIHIAGKRSGLFAILSHTGRRSGKVYRIPIIAEPVRNGFVFALTYGRNVDWYKNVAARGSCELRWKNSDYHLIQPEMISPEEGTTAFPLLIRNGLRMMQIRDYLRLQIA